MQWTISPVLNDMIFMSSLVNVYNKKKNVDVLFSAHDAFLGKLSSGTFIFKILESQYKRL